MLDSFIAACKKLFNNNDHLLIAVSGGIDSVVLCELCRRAGYSFSIAHCNFNLRQEESKRDEDFVRQLALHYNVPFHFKSFDTKGYATQHAMSIQEAARTLRYRWFNELVHPADDASVTNVLLTAHHADDNIETLLMNFFRGTGLHGLTGIPVRGLGDMRYVRRPLLHFFKDEIQQFAKDAKLQFVEDSSNHSSKYTRNFFRNELLPMISRVFPQVKENLLDNIRRASDTEALLTATVDLHRKKLFTYQEENVLIPVELLRKQYNRTLFFLLLQPFGFTENQMNDIEGLLSASSGRFVLAVDGRYRIIRNRAWLMICPVRSEEQLLLTIDEIDDNVKWEGGMILLSRKDKASLTGNPLIAELDARTIVYPLILRKVKPGDYFYPLGMPKKKKIHRFMIDQRFSKIAKENTWVLESNHRIIWVVGHRIDDRFKIRASTTNVLQLIYSGPE